MSNRTLLEDDAVATALQALPEWELKGRRIAARYEFRDFKQAFAFMTAVADEAERLNHHPDWWNSYREVRIELTTHDRGGLTALDLDLARTISRIAPTYA